MNIQNNLTVPIKTLKQATEIIGGYTVTSKMPTISYSISAKDCITGSKLRNIKNSVCSDCYALKGNYIRYAKNIEKAQNKRFQSITIPIGLVLWFISCAIKNRLLIVAFLGGMIQVTSKAWSIYKR